jgi:tetratricopeptide (TPR) repeat protein
MMNKRIVFLEQMIADGKADPFARYALALEFKKEGRIDESLLAFEALRVVDPDYLPQYLMAGQMLIDSGRKAEARAWLEPGLKVAQIQGNTQAAGEIESALADL